MTARRVPKTKLWPDLDELEARRAQCQAQIDARTAKIMGRGSIGEQIVIAETDIVLKNLCARLATYDADIERMNEHELVSLAGNHHGESGHAGKVWACACSAYGNAPTAFGALSRFNEHVTEAVWGLA